MRKFYLFSSITCVVAAIVISVGLMAAIDISAKDGPSKSNCRYDAAGYYQCDGSPVATNEAVVTPLATATATAVFVDTLPSTGAGMQPLDVTINDKNYDTVEILLIILLIIAIICGVIWIAIHIR